MSVYQIDPIQDSRWLGFLGSHPRASVFDSPGWLEALQRTYGYDPFVLTTSQPGADLTNGLPVCRVRSWLTGHRLVSLPFSDHCEPLVDRAEELDELLSFLMQEVRCRKWNYVEVRPWNSAPRADGNSNGFQATRAFCFHKLDLTPSLEQLFRRFHKSCVQRKIRRGEREGLIYEADASESHLAKFYHLLRLTRRRHGMPPQPLAWFRNLIDCMGENLTIHIVSKDGQPISSILTLSFKKTIVYKYGCSDAQHHNLGGMPFLFWRTIQEAKKKGLEELDLGRSDSENSGLVTFKDHLGADCSTLTYYRYPARGAGLGANGWKVQTAKRVMAHMPDPVLTVAGRFLYKHFG
jgi:CelD/BcsL family acetyltransferase involved in cellulose biosynthesis